jgi:hypothetical protein
VCRLFESVGDHERNRLALMAHPVVLEHVQALTDRRVHDGLVRAIGDPRRITKRQDGDDAGSPFRCRAVDGSDAAVRDRATHDDAVRHAGHVKFGGIGGRAGDLPAAVDAADRLSDQSGTHGRAPAISTARTMARCMSSILKLL